MAKKPRGSAGAGPSPEPGGGDPLQLNVPPELIAKALTELTDFDLAMASIAGKKGAAIKRYEEQGLDRAVMRGLQTLARGKTPDEAMAFILKLFKYGVAAEVLPKADDKWTTSVKQVEMFVPATGAAAEDLRYARAKKQGFHAGKKGYDIQSSPYQSRPDSPEFTGWRKGWQEGSDLRKLIKPGSENVVTIGSAPQRRASRKGAGAADDAPAADAPATAETIANDVAAELDSDTPPVGSAVH